MDGSRNFFSLSLTLQDKKKNNNEKCPIKKEIMVLNEEKVAAIT